MQVRIMGRPRGSQEWVEIRNGEEEEENEEIPGILIARIRDSMMTFGEFAILSHSSTATE